MLGSFVNRQGVVSVLVTVAVLTLALVDRQGVVSLPLEDCSVPDVSGHGVLTEMLVSSVKRHGVVSVLVTVEELIPCTVSVQDVSVPDIGGQGVLAEVLVSSLNRHGVVSLLVTVEELIPSIISVQDVSAPETGGHGVLTEMILSMVDEEFVFSINRYDVILAVITDVEITVSSLSISVEDISIPHVEGHGEMVFVCSVNWQDVVMSVKALEVICVKGLAVVSAKILLEDVFVTYMKKEVVLLDISVCPVKVSVVL